MPSSKKGFAVLLEIVDLGHPSALTSPVLLEVKSLLCSLDHA